jgi:hypothetical protein
MNETNSSSAAAFRGSAGRAIQQSTSANVGEIPARHLILRILLPDGELTGVTLPATRGCDSAFASGFSALRATRFRSLGASYGGFESAEAREREAGNKAIQTVPRARIASLLSLLAMTTNHQAKSVVHPSRHSK